MPCQLKPETALADEPPKTEAQVIEFPGSHAAIKPAYSFYSWLDLWLSTYKAHIEKKNFGILKSCIKCHIKANIPDFTLGEEHGLEIKQGLNKIPSARNLENAFAILREASEPALTQGLIPHSFVADIKPPKITRTPRNALRKFEQEIFLEKIKDSPMQNAFLFQLYTGCRPDESRKAKHKHFDFKQKTVFLDGTKNKFAKRKIPLFAFLRQLIESIPNNGDEFLFPFTEKAMAQEFARIMELCQFSRIYQQYSLRHTFGTRMAEKNVDIKTLAAWLGHSDTATTQKYYIESQPEHHAELLPQVDDTF